MEYLNLHDCDLQESGILVIGNALANVNFFKFLDISNNIISAKAAKKLSAAINCHITLEHVNFSNCFSDDAASFPILEALKLKKTLMHLNLESNHVTEKMANLLATVILNNIELKHINLSNCSISESSFLIILNSLKNMSFLECLILAVNNISSIVARHLAAVACNNMNLHHLNLSNTSLEVTPLFNNLTIGKIDLLQHSDLSYNVIDEQESKILAKLLANKSEMKHIKFSNCSISEFGIWNTPVFYLHSGK